MLCVNIIAESVIILTWCNNVDTYYLGVENDVSFYCVVNV